MKTLFVALALFFSAAAPPASTQAQPPPFLPIPMVAPPEPHPAPVPVQAPKAASPAKEVKVLAYRFSGSVNKESAAALASFLQRAVAEGAKLVMIEMNTPGGSYHAGHDISRYIEAAPIPVVCVADGTVASMGFYIMQSCDRRLITSRSMLMAHSIAMVIKSDEGVTMHIQDLQNLQDAIIVGNRAYANQIALRSKLTVDEYLAHIANGKEWWMTADEALKYGIVDGVWKGTPNTLYQALRQGQTP